MIELTGFSFRSPASDGTHGSTGTRTDIGMIVDQARVHRRDLFRLWRQLYENVAACTYGVYFILLCTMKKARDDGFIIYE